MLTLFALTAYAGLWLLAIIAGLMMGASAYRDRRERMRQQMFSESPITRAFYGRYQSVFPWHRSRTTSMQQKEIA